MLTSIIMLITISIGLSMVLTFTPLTLGLWILTLAMLTAIMCATSVSSWFAFIMFLIYIGGMLVMFAYFVAIQPNQQLFIIMPLFMLLLTIILFPIYLNMSIHNHIQHMNWWISTLFETINIPTLILLALILFLALISVVKITFMNRAPLRPFN
uniref:NADH dehydrogenase subunit 6 n=1 Tax=Goniada japonica TaxID=1644143 RepID=A0A0F6T5V4_9ANNE|nr:NADH dehydrogenase subunit 6 [Goniada japonica]AKE32085.1 NADH dehydrogenase subunit 6 [Goniada japonica]